MQRWVALEMDITIGVVREIFDLVGRRDFVLEDLQERISRAMNAHLAEQAGAAGDPVDKTT